MMKATILIVDDNHTNLNVLVDYLEEFGFEALVATNGERAIQQAQRFPPDLILLDVLMPGIDGFETCQRLKAEETTRDIPVIFMTALTDVKHKVAGFEVGAVDYVTKPFQQAELLARVSTHLTIRQLQKNLEEKNALLHREIGERKRLEAQLRYDASHDNLTGLANRALFIERLEQAIQHTHKQANYRFTILFLDLDGFKGINDTFGHVMGDKLLITVAHRLKNIIRPNDLVARLGGDEFTILLDGIADIQEATLIAKRIQAKLSMPVDLNGHQIVPRASIGIASTKRLYDRAEDLLRDADVAMYHSKADGQGQYKLFDLVN